LTHWDCPNNYGSCTTHQLLHPQDRTPPCTTLKHASYPLPHHRGAYAWYKKDRQELDIRPREQPAKPCPPLTRHAGKVCGATNVQGVVLRPYLFSDLSILSNRCFSSFQLLLPQVPLQIQSTPESHVGVHAASIATCRDSPVEDDAPLLPTGVYC
jgi:hypothetical protein